MTRTKMMRVFSTRDKAILMTTLWTSYRRACSSRMPFKLHNQSKTKESKAINHPRRIPTTCFLQRSRMRINTRKDSNSRLAAPWSLPSRLACWVLTSRKLPIRMHSSWSRHRNRPEITWWRYKMEKALQWARRIIRTSSSRSLASFNLLLSLQLGSRMTVLGPSTSQLIAERARFSNSWRNRSHSSLFTMTAMLVLDSVFWARWCRRSHTGHQISQQTCNRIYLKKQEVEMAPSATRPTTLEARAPIQSHGNLVWADTPANGVEEPANQAIDTKTWKLRAQKLQRMTTRTCQAHLSRTSAWRVTCPQSQQMQSISTKDNN